MKNFFRNKRNLYIFGMVMLTIVIGLSTVTFSYYVPESDLETTIEVSNTSLLLHSDDFVDGRVVVEPNQTKEITVTVISNSDLANSFKIGFESNKDNVSVYSKTPMVTAINPRSAMPFTVVIENYETTAAILDFNIYSNINYDDINVVGSELKNE